MGTDAHPGQVAALLSSFLLGSELVPIAPATRTAEWLRKVTSLPGTPCSPPPRRCCTVPKRAPASW
ncbi:hypothetical protein [Saccharopolyspora hattusasensis]|uniref:hypothetical protein n=1 Tax=Saccharopolyspora hattusasensis TaxID=1128679 RepID=UPI003D95807D